MKGIAAVLLCLGLVWPGATSKSYDGYQVFRVTPGSTEDVERLTLLSKEMNLDVWKESKGPGYPMDIMAAPDQLMIVRQHLENYGMTFRIMIENVDHVIHNERRSLSGNQIPPNSPPSDMAYYDTYHTNAEIDDWMDSMAATYSGMVTIEAIGTTYESRTMRVLKISTGGSGKPAAWFESGIHAREWISPAVNQYFTYRMLSNYGIDQTVTSLMDAIDIYILPVFNQDGYVHTWLAEPEGDRMWRKTRSNNVGSACTGTDPNRNWDNQWQGETFGNGPCTLVYPGMAAFSEQEVVNVANYMQGIPNLELALDIHSYSQYYMLPYGYQAAPPTGYNARMVECSRAVQDLQAVHGVSYQCGTIESLVGQAYGSSCDYFFDVVGAQRSYGIELRDTGEFGFLLPEDQIIPTSEENFAAFTSLLKDILP